MSDLEYQIERAKELPGPGKGWRRRNRRNRRRRGGRELLWFAMNGMMVMVVVMVVVVSDEWHETYSNNVIRESTSYTNQEYFMSF